jgi:hypothetical protein
MVQGLKCSQEVHPAWVFARIAAPPNKYVKNEGKDAEGKDAGK